MSNLCAMQCHDDQNDVNWGQPGKDVADKWVKLIHRTPGNNGPPIPRRRGAIRTAVIELIEGKK